MIPVPSVVEKGGSRIQGHCQLHREFGTSLDNMRPYPKEKENPMGLLIPFMSRFLAHNIDGARHGVLQL